ILNAHRNWEVGFMENELLHAKINVKSSTEKVTESTALVWQYDLPEKFKNPDATGQMYLTRVVNDYVVLLNTVINPAVSEARARRFLIDTSNTLKVSPERIDIKKLQEEIRRGNAEPISENSSDAGRLGSACSMNSI